MSENCLIYSFPLFDAILLQQAVENSLKSFNLFQGGVADRLAKKYSGGMRRRLSVAISLIGDPKVCTNLSSYIMT